MSVICDSKKNCFCLLKNNAVVAVKSIIQIIESREIFVVRSPCISNNI